MCKVDPGSHGNANISGNYFSQHDFYPRRMTACPCTSRLHEMIPWQTPHAACLLTVMADAVSAHQKMRLHLSNRRTQAASLRFVLNNFPFGPAFLWSPPAQMLPLEFPLMSRHLFRAAVLKDSCRCGRCANDSDVQRKSEV